MSTPKCRTSLVHSTHHATRRVTVIEEPDPKPNMLKKLGPPDLATTPGVVGAGAVAATDDEDEEDNDADGDDNH